MCFRMHCSFFAFVHLFPLQVLIETPWPGFHSFGFLWICDDLTFWGWLGKWHRYCRVLQARPPQVAILGAKLAANLVKKHFFFTIFYIFYHLYRTTCLNHGTLHRYQCLSHVRHWKQMPGGLGFSTQCNEIGHKGALFCLAWCYREWERGQHDLEESQLTPSTNQGKRWIGKWYGRFTNEATNGGPGFEEMNNSLAYFEGLYCIWAALVTTYLESSKWKGKITAGESAGRIWTSVTSAFTSFSTNQS